ncbi:MAG: HypC/HybG/HupF family hydrogenase formation chaperone [candidate division WOR-3 bacterium]
MCYAIPGKVIEIEDNICKIEYFGIIKKVRNDFYDLKIGDYVYAQGGFVIQKIPEEEARETLKIWEEFFYKLKEVDLRVTYPSKDLYKIANRIRQEYHDNSCCIHGIIEFSNYCRNNCLYCGLRKDNKKLKRYRMEPDEIINLAFYAINKLNFKALVFQSGEDLYYDIDKLSYIVKRIMEGSPCLLILSIGEREIEIFKRLYELGARAILLRFETSNKKVYEKMRPGHKLEDRVNLIRELKGIGYLIMTGFLIGLPGEEEGDILNNLALTNELGAEMFSFGPFIPHPDTPLKDFLPPPMEKVLDTIAQARILYPNSKILVTTAMQTLDKKDGLKKGLLAGANSLMINLTPKEYAYLYEIYPNRDGVGEDINQKIKEIIALLHELGRAPADIGL